MFQIRVMGVPVRLTISAIGLFNLYFFWSVWRCVTDENYLRKVVFDLFFSMIESNFDCFVSPASFYLNSIHKCFENFALGFPFGRLVYSVFVGVIISVKP